MPTTTSKLLLTFLAANQSDAQVYYNRSLEILDELLSRGVLSRTITSPPGSTEGDAYLVPVGATGDWATLDGQIVIYLSEVWVEVTPVTGLSIWVEDEKVTVTRQVGDWITATGEAIYAGVCAAGIASVTGTVGYIPWDTDNRNEAVGVYAHDTSTDPDEITLVEAGDYEIKVVCTFNATASTVYSRFDLQLELGGSDVTPAIAYTNTHSGNLPYATAVLTYFLAGVTAGQILKVKAWRGGGSSATANVPTNGANIIITKK